MSSDWIMLIPSKVFTKIKQDFSQTIKDTYNMTSSNFTTVGSNDTPAVFPFVYLQALPSSEIGMDFSRSSINGGLFSFQVDVTDNQSQARARKVMGEVIRIMKTMGFEVIQMPVLEDTKDIHRMTARFRRIIGANDKF